jgi:hypothetical protein
MRLEMSSSGALGNPRGRSRLALAAALLCLGCAAPSALAPLLPAAAATRHHSKKARRENLPPRGKIFFGVTDTGEAKGFESFADAVGAHPAVVETYHPWGNSLHLALPRWEQIHARPMLHISTAAGDDRHELITPKGIARGVGDDYLLRLNRSFAYNRVPAYVRPLGEPNRCLNPYTAIRCDGSRRGGRHTTHWYKQAFRRIYLILHGGARKEINRRLHRLDLPGIRRRHGREPDFLPRAPISVVWSPLPSGSPTLRRNSAAAYFPGNRYLDWVGADIYSRYTDFGAMTRFCHRYARQKPFAITEFGLWGADDPGFLRRLLRWVRSHRTTRMLVYYQDFGAPNPFRIQNFPAGEAVLRHALNSSRFPPRAPHFPRP